MISRLKENEAAKRLRRKRLRDRKAQYYKKRAKLESTKPPKQFSVEKVNRVKEIIRRQLQRERRVKTLLTIFLTILSIAALTYGLLLIF